VYLIATNGQLRAKVFLQLPDQLSILVLCPHQSFSKRAHLEDPSAEIEVHLLNILDLPPKSQHRRYDRASRGASDEVEVVAETKAVCAVVTFAQDLLDLGQDAERDGATKPTAIECQD
jgi:hypothetical protein